MDGWIQLSGGSERLRDELTDGSGRGIEWEYHTGLAHGSKRREQSGGGRWTMDDDHGTTGSTGVHRRPSRRDPDG